MVMLSWSVHIPTLFPGLAWLIGLPVIRPHTSLVTDNNPSLISGRRSTAVEIISWPVSTKVWDQAGIELATPGSEVRCVTHCNNGPGNMVFTQNMIFNYRTPYLSAFQYWRNDKHQTKCRMKSRNLESFRIKDATERLYVIYFNELKRIFNTYNLIDKLHSVFNFDEMGRQPELRQPNIIPSSVSKL